MKKLAAVLLCALGACSPEPTWESQVQDPGLPPLAPDRVLRKPPDFRLRYLTDEKEYFYYFYADEATDDTRVWVVDYRRPEGERRPVPIPPDAPEYTTALDLFTDYWKALPDLPDEKRLKFFNELHDQEKKRRATLLDQQLLYKLASIRRLQEEKYVLECDLKSGNDANAQVNPDRVQFLQQEIAERARLLRILDAQARLLEFRIQTRDSEYGLIGAVLFESAVFEVEDLLEHYANPEFLAAEIRTRVEPGSWKRSQAKVAVVEGVRLAVRQTPEVVAHVRAYLAKLRAEIAARAKQKTEEKTLRPEPK
jgi:hypothetical protein